MKTKQAPVKGYDSSDYYTPTNPAPTRDVQRQTREVPKSYITPILFAQELPRDPLAILRASRRPAQCYTSRIMYVRKLQADLLIGNDRRPAPLDWLDSFCMRNFTGSAEFDDTLPTAEGRLEAGLAVDPQRLAQAMSEWFTKRGKGNGQPVTIELRESEVPK
jgi:hypothetical protein